MSKADMQARHAHRSPCADCRFAHWWGDNPESEMSPAWKLGTCRHPLADAARQPVPLAMQQGVTLPSAIRSHLVTPQTCAVWEAQS